MKIKRIFVVIFLIALFVLGYFAYSKYYKSNKVYTEDLVISEAEDILNNKISNLYALFNESNKELNNMPNEKKLLLAVLYINNIENYKSNKILKKLRNIFGKNFDIEFKDIHKINDSEKIVYKYNSKSKNYTKKGNILGLDLIKPLKSELIDFKKEETSYILSYKQMFYNEFSENDKLNIVNIKGDKLFDIKMSNNINITNDMFNKYSDKLIVVDYIFKIENNKLVLKGYELK